MIQLMLAGVRYLVHQLANDVQAAAAFGDRSPIAHLDFGRSETSFESLLTLERHGRSRVAYFDEKPITRRGECDRDSIAGDPMICMADGIRYSLRDAQFHFSGPGIIKSQIKAYSMDRNSR